MPQGCANSGTRTLAAKRRDVRMQTKQREDGLGIPATKAAFGPDPEIGHSGRRSSDPAARALHAILRMDQAEEQLGAAGEVQRFQRGEEPLVRSLDRNRKMEIADRPGGRSVRSLAKCAITSVSRGSMLCLPPLSP